MLCAKEVSSYLGCAPNAWKCSYFTLILQQVNSSILVLYVEHLKWKSRWLLEGRESQSFQYCLHAGGFDRQVGHAGHTPRLLMLIWMSFAVCNDFCYIKDFYKTIVSFSYDICDDSLFRTKKRSWLECLHLTCWPTTTSWMHHVLFRENNGKFWDFKIWCYCVACALWEILEFDQYFGIKTSQT